VRLGAPRRLEQVSDGAQERIVGIGEMSEGGFPAW
jgi:hypothetical protein